MLVTQKNKIRHFSKADYKILLNLCHISKNYYNSALWKVNTYRELTMSKKQYEAQLAFYAGSVAFFQVRKWAQLLLAFASPKKMNEARRLKLRRSVEKCTFYREKITKLNETYIKALIFRMLTLYNGKMDRYANPFQGKVVYPLMKQDVNFKLLMSEYEAQVRKKLHENWKSFFALIKAWKVNPSAFRAKPNPPKYLPREEGKFLIAIQQRSIRLRGDHILISLSAEFKKKFNLDKAKEIKLLKPSFITEDNIQELRIVPKNNYLTVEFVYNKPEEQHDLIPNTYLSIDLGLDNLATCVDCQSGHSFIMDGRKLKSYNHWYNNTKARFQSIKDLQGIKGSTRYLQALEEARSFYIFTYMHKVTTTILQYCLNHKIANVLIGELKGIKQGNGKVQRQGKKKRKLSKAVNFKFVPIPFKSFKDKLGTKCKLHGINYIENDEAYTSKCSFLDGEIVEEHSNYLGKRITRGQFESNNGTQINADVNGAANLYVKYTGNRLFGAGSGTLSVPAGRRLLAVPVRVKIDAS